ncbi:MAG: DUF6011 domain-containing protein [Anaerolineaceae bacterium]
MTENHLPNWVLSPLAKPIEINGKKGFIIPGASLTCKKCGRKLTSEESIDRGYGPCCADQVMVSRHRLKKYLDWGAA